MLELKLRHSRYSICSWTEKTVDAAWDYFNNVQTPEQEYIPFITPDDKPAIFLNEKIMQEWRPQMRPYYYDASKFDTYLEQLGIDYPTVKSRPVTEDKR